MPRRKSVNMVRDVGVDPRFGLEIIQKFINVVMWRGKKNTARRIVYGALDIVARKNSNNTERALDVFHKAVNNSTPLIEVRGRRVGGSVYQIPREVDELRGRAIAFRHLIEAASDRNGQTYSIRLADELMEAADNRGGAVKKRAETHRMAEANRAFSHFSW